MCWFIAQIWLEKFICCYLLCHFFSKLVPHWEKLTIYLLKIAMFQRVQLLRNCKYFKASSINFRMKLIKPALIQKSSFLLFSQKLIIVFLLNISKSSINNFHNIFFGLLKNFLNLFPFFIHPFNNIFLNKTKTYNFILFFIKTFFIFPKSIHSLIMSLFNILIFRFCIITIMKLCMLTNTSSTKLHITCF